MNEAFWTARGLFFISVACCGVAGTAIKVIANPDAGKVTKVAAGLFGVTTLCGLAGVWLSAPFPSYPVPPGYSNSTVIQPAAQPDLIKYAGKVTELFPGKQGRTWVSVADDTGIGQLAVEESARAALPTVGDLIIAEGPPCDQGGILVTRGEQIHLVQRAARPH